MAHNRRAERTGILKLLPLLFDETEPQADDLEVLARGDVEEGVCTYSLVSTLEPSA